MVIEVHLVFEGVVMRPSEFEIHLGTILGENSIKERLKLVSMNCIKGKICCFVNFVLLGFKSNIVYSKLIVCHYMGIRGGTSTSLGENVSD
jgi:hypothetical protein